MDGRGEGLVDAKDSKGVTASLIPTAQPISSQLKIKPISKRNQAHLQFKHINLQYVMRKVFRIFA